VVVKRLEPADGEAPAGAEPDGVTGDGPAADGRATGNGTGERAPVA
jgi:hypothetical protein